jgi:galactose mutarotase-like enzyme
MDDYGRLTLSDPGGELDVTFLTRLGMVASSMRHRGEELLGQRGGPVAYAVHSSTFGIPLLHPWANRLSGWEYEVDGQSVILDREAPRIHVDGSSGLPIHGLLAASPDWRVVDHDERSVLAEFEFGAHPELLALFPFPHRLTYRAWLEASALTIELTVTPVGDRRVPISFGFHPYFALPGSPRAEWQVSLPVARRAVLSDVMLPTGVEEAIDPGSLDGPLAARTFDDCYPGLTGDPPVFAVQDGIRRVEVRFLEGYGTAQVFAPAGAELICFEPMTAPLDALRSGLGLRFADRDLPFVARFSVAVADS